MFLGSKYRLVDELNCKDEPTGHPYSVDYPGFDLRTRRGLLDEEEVRNNKSFVVEVTSLVRWVLVELRRKRERRARWIIVRDNGARVRS